MSEKLRCDRCDHPFEGSKTTIYNPDMTVKKVICKNCDALELKETYERTGRLSAQVLMNFVLGVYDSDPTFRRRIQDDNTALSVAIRHFEEAVWYGRGLQTYVQQAKFKGHSMQTPTVKAMLYAIAGRVLITLRDLKDTVDITIITAEDDWKRGTMGLQSINATKDEALGLIRQFVRFVQYNGLQFKVDNKVNII